MVVKEAVFDNNSEIEKGRKYKHTYHKLYDARLNHNTTAKSRCIMYQTRERTCKKQISVQ